MAKDMEDDFVFTIYDSDGPLEDEAEEQSPAEEPPKVNGQKRKRDSTTKAKKRQKLDNQKEMQEDANDDGAGMDPDFDFQLDGGIAEFEEFDGWGTRDGKQSTSNDVSIDGIVARLKKNNKVNGEPQEAEEEADAVELEDEEVLAEDAFGMGADSDEAEDVGSDENEEDEGSEDQDMTDIRNGEGSSESDEEVASPVPHPDDLQQPGSDDDEPEEDPAEKDRRAAFFAPESNLAGDQPPTATKGSFMEMSLSRPIMKGLAAAGFNAPTPIQHKAIPLALLGKDIVGSAVTGSGKTGAFILPILERLLFRSKKTSTTRVAILMPTRELALQCYNVARKLASFTDITFGQAIGGLNAREQENALKLRPDIVIATPGRFIDFMRNSTCLAVDTIEILVLDEADRMLEDGFADELNEILKTIPKSRQTMLFSATMTSSVDDLIRAGLNRPVRIMIDANRSTVAGLTQEFVRLRPGREDKRLGCLVYLCKTIYRSRTIVFFRQKKEAHRVRVIFALLDLPAAELHGSMSQEQRITAIEAFRSGKAAYLLATDLASRGLDIKNVETVINYEAPQSLDIYLHRVGRTARAGKTGRACTIAAEPDRKVVKAAVKTARANGALIKSRIIDPSDADKWSERVDNLAPQIEAVMREEKEERVMAQTEMQMRRADNLMAHEKEIMARPKKTWFESEKDKLAAKEKGRTALNGPVEEGAGGKKTKKKLSNKQKKKLDLKDERKEGRMWKKGKGDAIAAATAGKSAKGAKSQSKGKSKIPGKGKTQAKGKISKRR